MQRLRAVMNLVRLQVSAAVAAAPVPDEENLLDFQGTNVAMRFISAHSLVPGAALGRVLVNYRADMGPDGRWRLRFHEQALLRMDPTSSVDPDPGQFRELIGGLAGIRFEYLATDPSTGEPVWSDRWSAAADGSLPALVRFWVQPEPRQVPLGIATRLVSSVRK
jgi:hypothetical protein